MQIKQLGQSRQYRNKNEKLTNNRISTMEEMARGRKEGKRQFSHKRKTGSSQGKRPTSPKASTFYGKINGMDRPKFITKPHHQKMISATNGFELYQPDKVYADARPGKFKQQKRLGSKKQARIR